MKYVRQTQEHLDRLDQSLRVLRDMIKRGDNQAAIRYMEEGDLKERFGELQNIITLSSTGNLGASGIQSVGNL
tara:strand:+ start:1590 stop:1808 length:219 start_codon:yes stop_codon:yes gene_type:complete